jgi:hypothetical protein
VLENGIVVGADGEPLPLSPSLKDGTSLLDGDDGGEVYEETAEEAASRLLANRPRCAEFPLLPATKWDVVWDEPFSDQGWELAHNMTEGVVVAAVGAAITAAAATSAADKKEKEGKQPEGESGDKTEAEPVSEPELEPEVWSPLAAASAAATKLVEQRRLQQQLEGGGGGGGGISKGKARPHP